VVEAPGSDIENSNAYCAENFADILKRILQRIVLFVQAMSE